MSTPQDGRDGSSGKSQDGDPTWQNMDVPGGQSPYQAPGSPAPGYDYGNPSGTYQAPGGQPSGYGYPTAGYPNAGYPTAGYPSTGYPAPGYPAAAPATNGLAIASLVVSIAGAAMCCGLPSVIGAILGFVARRQIRDSRGAQSGDGMALAGIIIGLIAFAIGVIVLAFYGAVIAAAFTSDSSTSY